MITHLKNIGNLTMQLPDFDPRFQKRDHSVLGI